MLSITHLEVGTLATFLRLALPRAGAWPMAPDKYRNGALGQNWIQSARHWLPGQRVLDVGCGYSDLPILLARGGCEVWGADDFGLKSGDIYWLRGKHPEEFVKQHPEVRFVFERLGEDPSSFPQDYFDVVISNQALHVAKPPHAPIWCDMLRVMKKAAGSEMLVSMICNFGSDGDPAQAIQRLEEIRRMEHDILGRLAAGEQVTVSEFDALQERAGQSFHRFSPALYVAYVATVLGVKPFAMPAELLAENYCTRVNSLVDPMSVGFNNARFSNNPDEARKFRYGRYAPVLMRLIWDADDRLSQTISPTRGFDEWQIDNASLAMDRSLAGYSTQPIGTSRHVVLVENDADSTHTLSKELEMQADAGLSISVVAKPAGRNFLGLWLRGSQGSQDLVEAFFDLSTGHVASQKVYGQALLKGAVIEPIGEGWMRCTLRGTPSPISGKGRASILLRCNADGSSRFAGDGKSGVNITFPEFGRE